MTQTLEQSPKKRAIDVAVGGGIGVFSGMLGIGGGVFLVPFLVLRRHISQKRAQATSLVMVAIAAIGGSLTYAMNGEVAWIPALILLIGGLLGAWIGAITVEKSNDSRLQIFSGITMVVVAVRLIMTATDVATGNAAAEQASVPSLTFWVFVGYVLAGVAMGFLSALLGVGGGIVLIPVLAGIFGYEQQIANGTTLVVMVPVSLIGAYRLYRVGLTDWGLGLTFGAGAFFGGIVGATIALALSGPTVRYIFSAVLLILGLRMAIEAIRTRKKEQLEQAP